MFYGDLRHQCWLKVVATYYLINDTGDGLLLPLVPSCFRLATKIANLSLFWALGSSAFSLVLVQSLMILSLDFFRHLAF